ncbi:MAG: hypothetical protein ACTTKD_06755 [Peptoanaerobacter stomatis]|uniref:hypothetical protein n=1 Tax=Peptoanaerobacter stomatis TaxID=796937 RepID=UPI003F9F68E3
MKIAEVVNIMNTKQIIINYGLIQGAKKGQNVRIIEKGEEVYSYSKKKLGTLDRVKAELEIIQVYENFSICSKIARKTSSIFSGLNALTLETTKIEELNVKEEDITNINIPDITPIKNGDIAEIL